MTKIFFFTILNLSFFLTSCSSLIEEKSKHLESKKVARSDQTFFESLNEDEVRLVFRGVENPRPVEISLRYGITQEKLSEGYWELIGLRFKKQDYEVLSGGKRFVLRIKKNQNTYAGTYLVECPRVSQERNNILKEMTFFDRYSFKSSNRLCEVIVGDHLKRIQTNLNSSKEFNELKVQIGF